MKGEKTGGRTAGTPNKATAELRDLARVYTEDAVKELARLSLHAESEAARVGAIKELLDRGHGRATQTIESGEQLTEALKTIKVTFGS